jgi:dihydroorotate dehydrogenase
VYRWLRAPLFLIPAEPAHRLGMQVLKLLGRSSRLSRWKRARATRTSIDLSIRAAGLELANPVGLAAGLDKNAEAVIGLFALGFGAVEVGTVTSHAQPGNPKPRLFRIRKECALLNRMGFNNVGAAEVAARLARLASRPGPVGVNIGKGRDTPIEQAVEDYVRCAEVLAPVADYLVVNASSPNTPGLRQLQEPERLAALLAAVRSAVDRVGPPRPLLVKISPDLAPNAIDEIVDVAIAAGAQGLIATNTTTQRPFSHRLSSEQGGVSGAPLREMATQTVRRVFARSRGRLSVVGVGGIFSGADAYEKIRAGSSWVQIYTGLVYQGPSVVSHILRELEALLRRDGFTSLRDAVGTEQKS